MIDQTRRVRRSRSQLGQSTTSGRAIANEMIAAVPPAPAATYGRTPPAPMLACGIHAGRMDSSAGRSAVAKTAAALIATTIATTVNASSATSRATLRIRLMSVERRIRRAATTPATQPISKKPRPNACHTGDVFWAGTIASRAITSTAATSPASMAARNPDTRATTVRPWCLPVARRPSGTYSRRPTRSRSVRPTTRASCAAAAPRCRRTDHRERRRRPTGHRAGSLG